MDPLGLLAATNVPLFGALWSPLAGTGIVLKGTCGGAGKQTLKDDYVANRLVRQAAFLMTARSAWHTCFKLKHTANVTLGTLRKSSAPMYRLVPRGSHKSAILELESNTIDGMFFGICFQNGIV